MYKVEKIPLTNFRKDWNKFLEIFLVNFWKFPNLQPCQEQADVDVTLSANVLIAVIVVVCCVVAGWSDNSVPR